MGVVIVGILALLALLTTVAVMVVAHKNARRIPEGVRAHILREWEQVCIEQSADAQIIRADKLLHAAVKARFGAQVPLHDTLKKQRALFTNPKELFAARALRNRLAHEVGATCTPKEAAAALTAYHRALRDLGVG